jgi:flagellar basal body rod protein FlgF
MSTYKTVNDDYTITCNNGDGIFTVNAQTVFTGNVTYNQPSTSTSAFLTVAANNTGSLTDMGLLGQTGLTTFAGLRFDSTINAWQISPNVYGNGTPITAYANIATGTTSAAGSNTQVQFNQSGAFSASANLTYDYANSALTIQGFEVLGNIGTTPTTPSNAVAIYNNTIGGGGTGVYVLSSGVNDELVSKSKAIVYGIIF